MNTCGHLAALFFFLVSALAMPIPAAAQCQPRTDWTIYTVQAGDALSLIAGRYGITTAALAAANCLSDENIIYVGQKLVVPPPYTTPLGTQSFSGLYLLDRPSDAGGEVALRYALSLRVDGSAQLAITPLAKREDSAAQNTLEEGTWYATDTRLFVVLTHRLEGGKGALNVPSAPLTNPLALTFDVTDGFLTPIEYDKTLYGEDGLQFTLGAGDMNTAVGILQDRLSGLGWLAFALAPEDRGYYTESTSRAVSRFQQSQGLPVTGVVDRATYAALKKTPSPAAPPDGESGDSSPLPITTPDGKPILYLVFAGGESPFTAPILELLQIYQAQATFLLRGDETPSELERLQQRIIAKGHALRSDSLKHFPVGGINHWVDPHDWRQADAAQIAAYTIQNAHPGGIILLHQGGGDRAQTTAALAVLLQQLSAQGYAFHPMSPD
ncbi:MAG TPA: peptidoglycan-binding protein [Aggregatilineales bacterium]|nr:peptidoglycan-binding protein [Anaerolineales bacterium]HRE49063.1 peptidoglycan-binding protein [Aggregatilineales bacterium]